jgi:hypothetical protein
MQFAGPKDPPYPELPLDLLAKAGMICRTPEQGRNAGYKSWGKARALRAKGRPELVRCSHHQRERTPCRTVMTTTTT